MSDWHTFANLSWAEILGIQNEKHLAMFEMLLCGCILGGSGTIYCMAVWRGEVSLSRPFIAKRDN